MGWMMSEKTNLSSIKDCHQVVSFLVSAVTLVQFCSIDPLILKTSSVNQIAKRMFFIWETFCKSLSLQYHSTELETRNGNEWVGSANDLNLFHWFLCQGNHWIAFLFEILASSMKLVARDRISSSELKFLPKWTLWVVPSSIRIRGNIKARRLTSSN